MTVRNFGSDRTRLTGRPTSHPVVASCGGGVSAFVAGVQVASSCASMLSLRFALPVVVAALAACAARPGTPPASRAIPVATTPAGPNTTGPWRLAASYAKQDVTIATRATVVIAGDLSTRTDTLVATLTASYAWDRVAGRHVTGSLTDYRVAVGDSLAAVPAGLRLAQSFAAEESAPGGPLVFRLPAAGSACADPALSALQGLHDAWIPVPETVVLGQEWSDTVHTLSCRDRLAVSGVSVRRFRALRAEVENARVILAIDRSSTTRTTAEGEQFGEAVSLDGKGSGTMRYVLDVASGRFVRASGQALLDLTFRSRRRNQRVQQVSELTLTWKP